MEVVGFSSRGVDSKREEGKEEELCSALALWISCRNRKTPDTVAILRSFEWVSRSILRTARCVCLLLFSPSPCWEGVRCFVVTVRTCSSYSLEWSMLVGEVPIFRLGCRGGMIKVSELSCA